MKSEWSYYRYAKGFMSTLNALPTLATSVQYYDI